MPAACPRVEAGPRRASIGVLLPFGPGPDQSPGRAGDRLLAGLRLGLGQAASLDATVLTAVCGTGPFEVAAATDRLIDQGVEVLVGALEQWAVELAARICRGRGVALVVAGPGRHVSRDRLPGAVRCTHQLWQASYVMGSWAARQLDGDLFQVVNPAHADDDGVEALRAGFLDAGGSVVGRASTQGRPRGGEVADAVMAAWISGAGTVAVHASGRAAAQIVRAVRSAGLRVDLVLDGLGAEDDALADLTRGEGEVYSASAWCRSDATSFDHQVRSATGLSADAHAAVGHDVAVLVAEAADRLGDRSWSRMVDVLDGVSAVGVRGEMTVDATSGSTTTPIVVRRSRVGRNVVVARHPGLSGVPSSMTAGRSVQAYAGTVAEA